MEPAKNHIFFNHFFYNLNSENMQTPWQCKRRRRSRRAHKIWLLCYRLALLSDGRDAANRTGLAAKFTGKLRRDYDDD